MALADFNVTVSDVLDRYPLNDASNIGANTQPVSTGDVDDLIQDAESQLSAQLEKAGIDPASTTDDQERQAQNFVEVWCVAEMLESMGATASRYQSYRKKADDLLLYFDRDKGRWGDGGSSVPSNIDDTDTHARDDFTSSSYEF